MLLVLGLGGGGEIERQESFRFELEYVTLSVGASFRCSFRPTSYYSSVTGAL